MHTGHSLRGGGYHIERGEQVKFHSTKSARGKSHAEEVGGGGAHIFWL